MTPVSHGKPCAGNPHARFEEGASAPESPRRNALLHKQEINCKVDEEKQLTLYEAIAHAEEHVNDTPCGRQHKQLADWLKELREMKNSPAGNAAEMREVLEKAKKAICHYAEHICQSLSWENSNMQSHCADVL